MQHIQQMSRLSERHPSLAPLRVTTTQPSRWEQLSTWMKETGVTTPLTEILLATSTFYLAGGLLFSLYRALERYAIIPLP